MCHHQTWSWSKHLPHRGYLDPWRSSSHKHFSAPLQLYPRALELGAALGAAEFPVPSQVKAQGGGAPGKEAEPGLAFRSPCYLSGALSYGRLRKTLRNLAQQLLDLYQATREGNVAQILKSNAWTDFVFRRC